MNETEFWFDGLAYPHALNISTVKKNSQHAENETG